MFEHRRRHTHADDVRRPTPSTTFKYLAMLDFWDRPRVRPRSNAYERVSDNALV